jgi:hypothetical protein
MAARKAQPWRVSMAVTSVTQTWFGAFAEKSRPSRLGAMRLVFRLSVVTLNLRLRFPAIPSVRMALATVFSETTSPWVRSSRCTRGLPYVPRLLPWIARTFTPSWERRFAASEGSRDSQA